MKNLFLNLVLMSSLLNPSRDGIIKARYNYSMTLFYETDLVNDSCHSRAFINGKKLTCICGSDPFLIMIVYGHVQGFCIKHIPDIDIDVQRDCRL